jgi:hypothetical protein
MNTITQPRLGLPILLCRDIHGAFAALHSSGLLTWIVGVQARCPVQVSALIFLGDDGDSNGLAADFAKIAEICLVHTRSMIKSEDQMTVVMEGEGRGHLCHVPGPELLESAEMLTALRNFLRGVVSQILINDITAPESRMTNVPDPVIVTSTPAPDAQLAKVFPCGSGASNSTLVKELHSKVTYHEVQ